MVVVLSYVVVLLLSDGLVLVVPLASVIMDSILIVVIHVVVCGVV